MSKGLSTELQEMIHRFRSTFCRTLLEEELLDDSIKYVATQKRFQVLVSATEVWLYRWNAFHQLFDDYLHPSRYCIECFYTSVSRSTMAHLSADVLISIIDAVHTVSGDILYAFWISTHTEIYTPPVVLFMEKLSQVRLGTCLPVLARNITCHHCNASIGRSQ